MNIEPILDTVLDDRTKGIPGGTAPFALKDVGQQGWNVLREDMPLPLLVLKGAVMDRNSRQFQKFLKDHQVSFAPHGKTTMCPQLFKQQLEDGAWAMTAATVNQIQVYRRFGVSRILLANQLIGRQNVRYIVEQLNQDPAFDFFCLVDSVAQVEQIAAYAREFHARRPIKALIEGGTPGGRTGCRTVEIFRSVAASVGAARDVLALAGVEGYEGIIPGPPDEAMTKIDEYLNFLKSLLGELGPEDFSQVDEVILSAGGTAFFDRVVHLFKETEFPLPVRVVVRSGCYLTHDSGTYRLHMERAKSRGFTGELKPALEIWSYVQSIPEPGLAILTMGKRDCPYDAGLPVPQALYRPGAGHVDLPECEVTLLNDQHGYLKFPPDTDLGVGDMLACGISHPCTAFDKWKFVPVVSEDYDVTGGVLTFF